MTLCGWCGRKMLGYGARCPACVRREQRALGAAFVAIVLLIGVSMLCGCGGPLEQINAANEAAAQLRKVAAPMIDEVCVARAVKCRAAGVTVPEQCAPWVACRDARRGFVAVISGLHLAAANAASLIIISRDAKLDTILAEVLDALDRARKLAAQITALDKEATR